MPTEATIDLSQKHEPRPPAQSVTELAVSGMTCANCARHVTEAIQGVPGVRSASVDLDNQRASVRWAAAAPPNISTVIQAIEKAGYGAKVIDTAAHGHHEHKLADWQLNLWIGVLGTSLLMAGEWILGLGMAP